MRAEAGPLRGAEAVLEVAAVDPVVLLEVVPSEWQNETALLCTGNVTAAGRPVPGAAVRIVFDGCGTADCTTGPAGQFELLAGVAGGSHQVVANVSFADGRPINPGSSPAVRAEVAGGFPVLPVLGALLALLLAGAGGFLFWRRSRAVTAVPCPRSSAPPPPGPRRSPSRRPWRRRRSYRRPRSCGPPPGNSPGTAGATASRPSTARSSSGSPRPSPAPASGA